MSKESLAALTRNVSNAICACVAFLKCWEDAAILIFFRLTGVDRAVYTTHLHRCYVSDAGMAAVDGPW